MSYLKSIKNNCKQLGLIKSVEHNKSILLSSSFLEFIKIICTLSFNQPY